MAGIRFEDVRLRYEAISNDDFQYRANDSFPEHDPKLDERFDGCDRTRSSKVSSAKPTGRSALGPWRLYARSKRNCKIVYVSQTYQI